jgi:quercetin dioxygenase-like cupin family protein
MTTWLDDLHLHSERFSEIPGMRGLRVARIAHHHGATIEIVEAQKGVLIPAVTHPSKETGRVLKGKLRFMQEGVVKELHEGDSWVVEAGAHQGPHVILEDDTRVALLREGKSAFDVV